MAAFSNSSFLITLNQGNNYTAKYDLSFLEIRNVRYMSVYSDIDVILNCPFAAQSYTLISSSYVVSRSVATSEDSGVIYEIPNLSVRSGVITLATTTSFSTIGEPISILFTFYEQLPELVEKPVMQDSLVLQMSTSSLNIPIRFNLNTEDINGYEYFTVYSNFHGMLDTTIQSPVYFVSSSGQATESISRCLINTNRLEYYKCVQHIKNGAINFTLDSVPNSLANLSATIYFRFFKTIPK